MTDQTISAGPRQRARALVEATGFQRAVLTVIVVNAVALGVETAPGVVADYGALLRVVEVGILVAFAAEMVLRLYAGGLAFFRDPWNLLDLAVVALAMLPVTHFFSVIRLIRVLRLVRLLSAVPSLRRVVTALVNAVPGIGSVIVVLLIVLYSGAVLGVQLFRPVAPDTFGTLGRAMYTMFELMTVTGWQNTADPILAERPGAWVFFVVYLLATAFILLNLLVGVIVGAMQTEVTRHRWREDQAEERRQHDEVMAELRELREIVRGLQGQETATVSAPRSGGGVATDGDG